MGTSPYTPGMNRTISSIGTGSLTHFSKAASDSCREACFKAIEIVKEGGGRISFDPNVRPELLGIEKTREICSPVVQASELILPSGEEACMLTGLGGLEEACQKLLESCSVLALKLGADGSKINSRLRKTLSVSLQCRGTEDGDGYW